MWSIIKCSEIGRSKSIGRAERKVLIGLRNREEKEKKKKKVNKRKTFNNLKNKSNYISSQNKIRAM